MTAETRELVTLETDGDVAVIRLDDGKANALSHAVVDSLRAAVQTASTEAGAIALIGREGKFSAGFDLTTMQAGPAQAQALLVAGAEFGKDLYRCPIPVVIGCTGHAIAMGSILLMCADVRIGADGPYKIGLNEVAIGMPVPRFAIELARDRLSPRYVTAAVNLATLFSPAEAIDAGFLDAVAPLADVGDAAIARAHALAGGLQRGAFRWTRELFRGPAVDRLDAALAQDAITFAVAPDRD